MIASTARTRPSGSCSTTISVRVLDDRRSASRCEELLGRRLPEALAALLAGDPDPLLAERPRARAGRRRRASRRARSLEPLGREPRDRSRRVAAHRGADGDERPGHLLKTPSPTRRSSRRAGTARRDRVELGELRLPHPPVERQRVQERDLHRQRYRVELGRDRRALGSPSSRRGDSLGAAPRRGASRRRTSQGT